MKALKTWFTGTATVLAVALTAMSFVAAEQQEETRMPRIAGSDTTQVDINVGPEGFEPSDITLLTDQPARIVFTRTTDATCAEKIHIPEFGVEATELPLNEPVAVDVRPEEGGTFSFACAMDMMKGAILVKSD